MDRRRDVPILYPQGRQVSESAGLLESRVRIATAAGAFIAITLASLPTFAQRQIEHLGRGVVAIHEGEGQVFVSWRLLGTDTEDPAFNLYRQAGDEQPRKLNEQPLAGATHYRDTGVD